MLKIALIVGVSVLFVGYSINAFFKTETASYKIVQVHDSVEIRAYNEMIYASYTPEDSVERSNSFGKVANYIFGNNSTNEKIAMTSPVVIKPNNNYEMAFIMPDQYTISSLPKPSSAEVSIYSVPSSIKAAIQYSGFSNPEKEAQYKQKLIAVLAQNNIAHQKDFHIYVYDAPYKLLNRRNEIVVSVTLKEDEIANTVDMDKIYLGGGCFWCVEAVFENVIGVHKVVSGYSGGTLKNPSYTDVAYGSTNHAEVCEISFNNQEVNLENLLKVFFATHDPTTLNRQGYDVGEHYRSIVLYSNQFQKEITENVIQELNSTVFDGGIVTQLVPFESFYYADVSHQNYYANNQTAPYCSVVISPKIEKLKKHLSQLYKK